jgi:hypothetical protein
VVDVSGSGYNDVLVRKLARMKAGSCFMVEGWHRFSGPFDWAAERVIGKVGGVEEFS